MSSPKTTNVNVLQTDGSVEIVGSQSVTVLQRNDAGHVQVCKGATVPAAGDAGFGKGCLFILTTGGAGTTTYINEGTSLSAAFNASAASNVQTEAVLIATTGNSDAYIIAPVAGKLALAQFTSVGALAASDTNYITFSLTNLGQGGAGSTAMLAATAANTTQVTGGTALTANGTRALTLHGTAANLVVAAGDVIRVRYAATGTLVGTVAGARTLLRFN